MSTLASEPAAVFQSVPKDGRERRRCPRFPRHSAAQLIYWPASTRTAPIDVEVVDYSQTGVGIVHNESILVGQKFVLREPFVTQCSTCLYTVVRCDPCPDGRFSIGLHISESQEDRAAQAAEQHRSFDWSAVAYFIFALFGATAIVATAILNR